MSKLQVVVGGQFGSEAKGHVAGYLARADEIDLAIRVAGPNAGHSVVHPKTGTKYALRQVPVAAVTNPNTTLAIAAGSEIDPRVLRQEIDLLEGDGIKVASRLLIDPSATILTVDHVSRETSSSLTDMCGSTSKGIGAARADRIWRRAKTAGEALGVEFGRVVRVADWATVLLRDGNSVQVEGTQGYGLGLHGPFYPFATSSDCTALDFLAMAQISPWAVGSADLEIWVVFRPYPIRVAGNSGPLTGETSWEALGLDPEYTTVTKKMRRVGAWDPALAAAAMQANGWDGNTGVGWPRRHASTVRVALTMADQIDPSLAGSTDPASLHESLTFSSFRDQVQKDAGVPPLLVSTSDRTMVDLRGLGY